MEGRHLIPSHAFTSLMNLVLSLCYSHSHSLMANRGSSSSKKRCRLALWQYLLGAQIAFVFVALYQAPLVLERNGVVKGHGPFGLREFAYQYLEAAGNDGSKSPLRHKVRRQLGGGRQGELLNDEGGMDDLGVRLDDYNPNKFKPIIVTPEHWIFFVRIQKTGR